jgi:hypothetical protein
MVFTPKGTASEYHRLNPQSQIGKRAAWLLLGIDAYLAMMWLATADRDGAMLCQFEVRRKKGNKKVGRWQLSLSFWTFKHSYWLLQSCRLATCF